MELEVDTTVMRVMIKMINSCRIEKRSSTPDTVDAVSFCQEEFRQIGAVLVRYPCDQSSF